MIPFFRGNRSAPNDAGSKYRRAFKLRSRGLRIYHQPCVHRRMDDRNFHFAFVVHFDFHDRGYVSQKLRWTAMPIPDPLPSFFFPQPDLSAAISITRRTRAVSSG